MSDPEAVVSPGGVGFDINCGVRLIRTNLMEKDVTSVKEELAQSLFDHIPVGVGSQGVIPTVQVSSSSSSSTSSNHIPIQKNRVIGYCRLYILLIIFIVFDVVYYICSSLLYIC